uniref:Uncharacterized protein n=1 Tax=Capra hircus TaxID=9925 RepID=A0A8C2RKE7_CAPHI
LCPPSSRRSQPCLLLSQLGTRVALAGRAGLRAPLLHAAAHVFHARDPSLPAVSAQAPGGHGRHAVPVGLCPRLGGASHWG